jgi:flavin reductase (DIM6/NTAB) family NADH-FMN oxidoreductase RutF
VKTDAGVAGAMDPAAKKHALRLVPYGLYLAGSRHADGHTAVSLVSWFTQTSFDPPLVVLGMHREGEAFKGVKETGVLAVSLLGSAQKALVKPFFKHVVVTEGKAGPLSVTLGAQTGCPVLPDPPASLELKVRQVLELGEHATVVFEVVDAHVHHKDLVALDHKTAGLHYAG